MDKTEKSNVVKSKSSNSAITTKSDNHSSNKKTRSNAEFTRNVMKKRGVYVEKKATDINIHKAGNPRNKSAATVKAPPRPKPGQKRFLASVLTILSKSTAATQFPGSETKMRRPKRTDNRTTPKQENKKKYRSKVLNDEMIKSLDHRKSLVLQYKNINNNEGNISESESAKFRELSTNKNYGKSGISIMSSEAKGVVKQVLEGLNMNKDRNRAQEPVTQVEKINRKDGGRNDEQLYNFFVDLLETTFSVYNVKTEYDAAPNIESTFSSKVAFEIEEAVVKKLEHGKDYTDDGAQDKSNFYYVNDANAVTAKNVCAKPCKARQSPLKIARPSRLRAQSFIYNTKPIKPLNSTKSNTDPLVFPKKRISRKAKKRTLMNMFREQLSVGYHDYEEPQTLFEALKVMARNKKKNEAAIRFDMPVTKECVFRQPKIISEKKPKKKYGENRPCEKLRKDYGRRKPKQAYIDSNHTLEVHGYDYKVDNSCLKSAFGTEKEVSNDFLDENFDFDDYDTLNNTEDHIDMFEDE